MTIDRSSWHYRAYSWFRRGQMPYTLNLCPYVRAVFLWAPLAWLFVRGKIRRFPVAVATWSGIVLAIHAALYRFFGYEALWLIVHVEGIVIAFAVFVGGGSYLAMTYADYQRKTRRELLRSQLTDDEYFRFLYTRELPARLRKPSKLASLADGISSGFALLREFAHAAHNKICPVIEVK